LAKDRDFLRGLTFDDVLLKPGFSEVIPQEVDICSQFSSRISLRLPIISAAMDTVTEKEMAIEMALQGGLGIIHKNMSIEKQASQVRSVKRYESVMISDPITVSPNETIGQLKDIMEQYNVSGVPVVDKNRKILGIVTKRDLIFEDDDTIQIKKVMTPRKNLITGSNGISLEEVKKILRKHKVEKLPLVDKDDKLTGLITLRDILKRKEFPEANIDEEGRLYCGASVGVASNTIERAQELIKAGVDCIVIDTAHGHTKKVFEVAKRIRRLSSDCDIVVGNIATGEAAKDILKLDIDAIKVGVGPGSICTTRVISGVGVPQLSAIMEVTKVVEGKKAVISDGGITYSGDITKALAAGAYSVMIGNLLAGTDEAPGDQIFLEGRRFKVYRGMGSLDAMKEGSSDRYFQSTKLVPEGVVARIPYRGPVGEVLYQLSGGLKSGMGYVGAKNLKELREKAEFVRITHAGVEESHPHDVEITKEPPNYEI
jgi:IMP dehydrogenase